MILRFWLSFLATRYLSVRRTAELPSRGFGIPGLEVDTNYDSHYSVPLYIDRTVQGQ
jgi:hypothetical protein